MMESATKAAAGTANRAPEKIGVLVMSYGTPENLNQVEAYYTHIRRGHPPGPEELRDLVKRYERIAGGVFPLRRNTDLQVAALAETLRSEFPDRHFACYQGLKHASPFIEDGVKRMAEDGIRRAVGVVLAPHYSAMSVGGYIKRAKAAAEEAGIAMECVESYHLHPLLIKALAERLNTAMHKFHPAERAKVRVLFTAHSLPERILRMNDPYPQQLLETSRAAAEAAGIAEWRFAWQSAGKTGEPWLGPDVLEELARMRREEGAECALICAVGFVSDHLEVLYDLDIEAQALARELGMHLERTEMLNSDPLYMRTLADVIHAKLAALKGV